MDWTSVVTVLVVIFQFVVTVLLGPYNRTVVTRPETDKVLIEVQGIVPVTLKVNGVPQTCVYFQKYVCGTGVVNAQTSYLIEANSNGAYTVIYREYDEQVALLLPSIMKRSNETNSGGLPFDVESTPVE